MQTLCHVMLISVDILGILQLCILYDVGRNLPLVTSVINFLTKHYRCHYLVDVLCCHLVHRLMRAIAFVFI